MKRMNKLALNAKLLKLLKEKGTKERKTKDKREKEHYKNAKMCLLYKK
jgi:hypothetical protein